MITNAMAVIHLLQTLVDVYTWLNDEIADHELMARIKKRKAARIQYITTEKQRIRLEILRELDRNNPSVVVDHELRGLRDGEPSAPTSSRL